MPHHPIPSPDRQLIGLRLDRVGDDDGKSLLEGWTGYLVEFTHAD